MTSAPRSSTRAVAALAVALLAHGARADVLDVPGDFATVDLALAAAVEGDEIVLAAGSYNNPVLIDGKAGIVVRGQGQVLLGGGTQLAAALSIVDSQQVTVERLTIVSPDNDGVFIAQSSQITLSRVTVEDAGGEGIVGGESGNVLLDRCRVDGAVSDGIAWFIAGPVTLSRCEVSGAGGAGIRMDEVDHSLIERCRVTGGSSHGITVGLGDASNTCTVQRNVVIAPGFHGIVVRGTDNCVLDNRVQAADGAGIRVMSTSSGGVVDGNRLIGCQVGILAEGTDTLVCDNRIVKSLASGISVLGQGAKLVDNRAQKCGTDGFSFSDAVISGSLVGCIALQPGEDGFDVAADLLDLTGNLSSGAALIGFRLSGEGLVLAGNTAKGSGTEDCTDSTGLNTYLGNSFEPGSPP